MPPDDQSRANDRARAPVLHPVGLELEQRRIDDATSTEQHEAPSGCASFGHRHQDLECEVPVLDRVRTRDQEARAERAEKTAFERESSDGHPLTGLAPQ